MYDIIKMWGLSWLSKFLFFKLVFSVGTAVEKF